MSVIWNTCGFCGGLIHRETGYSWLDQHRETQGVDPVPHDHDPFGPWEWTELAGGERLLTVDRSHDRHDGRREFLALLDNVESGNGYGDGTGTYDDRTTTVEGYMVAGNGPTGWAWFVLRSRYEHEEGGDEIDHAYLELYTGGQGPQLIPIPTHLADSVLGKLRMDTIRRHGR